MTGVPPTDVPSVKLHQQLLLVQEQVNTVVLGKQQQVAQALACLLAGGHLLLEDTPGVGKTLLARTLGHCFALDYARVQFTADLLPADVLGCAIYDRDRNQFHFQAGPVFNQLLLADEINRAPPKTQSALLEAMEEQQVSVDGDSHKLPAPFFVVATQNPQTQIGTFALPESQLDRFMLRLSLGYPAHEDERRLLAGDDQRSHLNTLTATGSAELLLQARAASSQLFVSAAVIDYVQGLLHASREHSGIVSGLSSRAGIALLRLCKAHAWLQGRDHVLPDDVQALFVGVAAHRLQASHMASHLSDDRQGSEALAQELLATVAVP